MLAKGKEMWVPEKVKTDGSLRNARYRLKKKAIDQSIIAEYNQIEDHPVASLKMSKPSMKGSKRQVYNPPDQEMKSMTKEQISEWRRNEKKKRNALRMRENRARKAAMLKRINDKVEENRQKMVAAKLNSMKDKVRDTNQKVEGTIETVKPATNAKAKNSQAIESDKPSNSNEMIEQPVNAANIGYLDDIDSFMDAILIKTEDLFEDTAMAGAHVLHR